VTAKIDEGEPEAKPTCLIIDPIRRFGSKHDRLFSDLTARAFWRAGWNVVWMVDHDDMLADRPYALVRRSLPSAPLPVGADATTADDDGPLPLEGHELTALLHRRQTPSI